MTEKEYLTIKQLSKRLQIPVGTLYYWKHINRIGPPWHKFGRGLRYEVAEVEKWEKAHFSGSEAA